jgi:hypothetical protein
MKQHLLILAAITVLLAHCRKKDHQPFTEENNHFLKSGLTHFTPVRLFTHNGEVVNPGLAQTYQDEFTLHFYEPGDPFIDPFYQEIIFINDDSILYVTPGKVFNAKRTVTGAYDRFSTPYFDVVSDTSSLDFYIVQYKTFRRKEIPRTNNPNNFVYYEVDNPVYFLKKVQDTVFMPIIKYATISRMPGMVTFAANKFNNVFSADSVGHLGANDTLIVQSFDLAFVKGK